MFRELKRGDFQYRIAMGIWITIREGWKAFVHQSSPIVVGNNPWKLSAVLFNILYMRTKKREDFDVQELTLSTMLKPCLRELLKLPKVIFNDMFK